MAAGVEIGQPGKTYRRIRLTSGYGKMVILVNDGALPWPCGHDLTGYAVPRPGRYPGQRGALGHHEQDNEKIISLKGDPLCTPSE